MLWALAAVDLAGGAYLLGWALRREQRDKPAVLALGVVLLVCAAVILGLALLRPLDESPGPVPPPSPTGTVT